MIVIDSAEGLPKEPIIVALGVFDGVHLGHEELFRKAFEIKKETGFQVMCLTFEPHPRAFLGIEKSQDFRLLSLPQEKKALMSEIGCDYYWALPFDLRLSRMSPKDFAKEILRDSINASHVVCGFNFTFGYKGLGTPRDLLGFGKTLGFHVTVVEAVEVKGDLVSSSRIRQDLSTGSVEDALFCLGRPYCVYGRVGHGDGRGRSLGLPTSNVRYSPEKVLPSSGVYWGVARWPEFRGNNRDRIEVMEGRCAVNIGTKPTFGGSRTEVEVHVPGASLDLYGETMQVFFLGKIREERRFQNAEALRIQIQKDLERIEHAKDDGRVILEERLFSSPFPWKGAYDRIFQNLP